MKIGVYFGGVLSDPKSGGGYTFQYSLLQAIKRSHSTHEFVILDSLQKNLSTPQDSLLKKAALKCLRYFDTREVQKKYKSLLNRAVLENNIDMVWFVTPAHQFVEVPYLYTVWDLQHRHQSFFPEVSVTGSTFEERERHYANVIPRAAYVLSGNETAKREVMRFYGMSEQRVETLELPTPDFVFDKTLEQVDVIKKYDLKRPYVFYPAQFWPHKNHITLLYAIKQLKEQGSLVDLVLTGSDKGNLAYVQEIVATLGLHDQVHFLGFVSIPELVALYRNACALTFASFFGPNNIPPLEAFALGCPVIAADVDGMREQLGDAALFFNPRSLEQLAQHIQTLLNDYDLRQQLIVNGLQRANSWTCDDYVKKIIKILDEFAPVRRCWSSTQRYIHG